MNNHVEGLQNMEELQNMTTRGLISVLRAAIRITSYDEVEQILVAREENLRHEISNVRSSLLELERVHSMEVEAKIEECKKISAEKKRVEDMYEKLLGNVKKSGLSDSNAEDLKAKNVELENKVKIWKGKFLELSERILKLECDIEMLVKGKNERGKFGDGVLVEAKKEVVSDEVIVSGNKDLTLENTPNTSPAGGSSGQKRAVIEVEDIIEIDDSGDDDEDNDNSNDRKEGNSQFVKCNGNSNSVQKESNQTERDDFLGRLKRKYELEGLLTTDKRSKA